MCRGLRSRLPRPRCPRWTWWGQGFILFHRVAGKLKRTTLGRWPRLSLAEARNAWRNVRDGRAPLHDEGQSAAPLFEMIIDEWQRRDQSGNKASSQYQVARIVERDLLPVWRGRRIDEITKRDVIAVLDAIADRGAATKARQTHSHLNRFFRWCVERDVLTANPMAGLKRGDAKSRDRVLSDKELAAVWQAAPEIGLLGTAVRLLILTGARREEITQLRWSEIQGDDIHLEGDRTKNGEAHIIPLTPTARAILDKVPRIADSDFVFTNNGVKPIVAWARPKAELDDVSGNRLAISRSQKNASHRNAEAWRRPSSGGGCSWACLRFQGGHRRHLSETRFR